MSQGSGGEKTEKATPKKRKDAREKGQVRQSQDTTVTFCSLIMFGLLLLIWPWFTDRLMGMLSEFFGPQSIVPISEMLTQNEFRGVLNRAMMSMLVTLLPIVGTAMIAGLAISLVQVGFLFTTKTLTPKLSKISPLNGLKRMFSSRTVVDLVKSLLKIAALGFVAYSDYRKLLEEVPGLIGHDVYAAFLTIMRTAFLLALKMCLVMVFVAALDFFYQWWKHEKDLKMTKQEVKDEYKLSEGDPMIKGKIRQKQRQMSAMRMIARVPEADVVITNPTHYAVALKYDDKKSPAPIVTAKGQDFLARKIKEVAQEHNVQIVENKPLAQSLYAMCEVDDEIPAELYQAVADVLVFVYKQKGRVR